MSSFTADRTKRASYAAETKYRCLFKKKKNLNNDNLPKETQIFVLLTVFTLFFVRQKEERLKKEDLEGRGRENDYGCSPTTTAATRRTERQTAAGRAATPEDEDARLTTTRVDVSFEIRDQIFVFVCFIIIIIIIIIIMLPISLCDLNTLCNTTMFSGNTKLTIFIMSQKFLVLRPVSQSSPRYVCQSRMTSASVWDRNHLFVEVHEILISDCLAYVWWRDVSRSESWSASQKFWCRWNLSFYI